VPMMKIRTFFSSGDTNPKKVCKILQEVFLWTPLRVWYYETVLWKGGDKFWTLWLKLWKVLGLISNITNEIAYCLCKLQPTKVTKC
jgi:hypothetical protein